MTYSVIFFIQSPSTVSYLELLKKCSIRYHIENGECKRNFYLKRPEIYPVESHLFSEIIGTYLHKNYCWYRILIELFVDNNLKLFWIYFIKLKTMKKYNWGERESTEAGTSLIDLIEFVTDIFTISLAYYILYYLITNNLRPIHAWNTLLIYVAS